jgi:subtilisin family serine protease
LASLTLLTICIASRYHTYRPGVRIRTASTRNRTRFGAITGTSIAAPHVTGVIARYLERNSTMTPDQIREKLLNDASTGQLIKIFQLFSPNKLLYVGQET